MKVIVELMWCIAKVMDEKESEGDKTVQRGQSAQALLTSVYPR